MASEAKEKGNTGENIALAHFESLGFRVVARNFHSRFGELDLVLQDPKGVVRFVEVKNYQHGAMVHPMEMVERQMSKLQKAAQYFILKNGLNNHSFQFDVAVVEGGKVAEHYENVFSA